MIKFDRPTLVTFTAPTCSGKTHLLNHLTESARFSRIVSTTTRARRPGEVVGVDYDYISVDESKQMEADGEFFELIKFNGVRYGVTQAEMDTKMNSGTAPIVILEPQGLEIYEQKCQEHGWDIFKVYVHTTESVRLERLLQRSLGEAWRALDDLRGSTTNSTYGRSFHEVAIDGAKTSIAKTINEHQRRLKSILGEERRWSNVTNWDAIIPGDDVKKATAMIEQGIKWRNRLRGVPQPYTHKM